MLSQDMLYFLPLHTGAIDSQRELLIWLESWWEDMDVLSSKGWFVRGHDIYGYCENLDKVMIPMLKSGTFVWSFSSTVANVAIEELRWARYKRKTSFRVFLCPERKKHLWIDQLYKAADIVMEIKAN